MPRMNTTELHEILDKGTGKLGMSIDAEAKIEISKLSKVYQITHIGWGWTLCAWRSAISGCASKAQM